MYKILIIETGDVFYTSAILYVKRNQSSGAWIKSDADDAEAVAVAGHLLNLPDHEPVDGLNTALIKNLDVAANLQVAEHNISQNSADVDNLVGAVCDVGADQDMLINAVLELNERLEAMQNV